MDGPQARETICQKSALKLKSALNWLPKILWTLFIVPLDKETVFTLNLENKGILQNFHCFKSVKSHSSNLTSCLLFCLNPNVYLKDPITNNLVDIEAMYYLLSKKKPFKFGSCDDLLTQSSFFLGYLSLRQKNWEEIQNNRDSMEFNRI